MEFLINIIVTMIVLVAALSAAWAGNRTGNYWGLALVLLAVTLYWFLTLPSRRGTTTNTLQYGITRLLTGLLASGVGIVAIWKGIAEFSSPVTFAFRITNYIANLIRSSVGSIGVSMLLWWFGGAILIIGLRLLRFDRKAR